MPSSHSRRTACVVTCMLPYKVRSDMSSSRIFCVRPSLDFTSSVFFDMDTYAP